MTTFLVGMCFLLLLVWLLNILQRGLFYKPHAWVYRHAPKSRQHEQQLLMALPGAFSGAEFQFQPVAANLPFRGAVAYVESGGNWYDPETVIDTAVECAEEYVRVHDVNEIYLLGSSMGGGLAALIAHELRQNVDLDNVAIHLIAIDGVARTEDLTTPAWLVQLIGGLPFDLIANLLLPLSRLIVQPSPMKPHHRWKEHAASGLQQARRTPTTYWGGQMCTLGRLNLQRRHLERLQSVTYISSTLDTSVLKVKQSANTWRTLAWEADVPFRLVPVEAHHTDYEAKPVEYAQAIAS